MAGRLAAVTGATGFLGPYIIRALARAGWRLRILARQAPACGAFGDPPIGVVVGDMSNRRALRKLVDSADIVVHAAGLIKAPSRAAFRAVNVDGTANLVRAINDCPSAGHVILVSSMVAREPHLSAYAATKREGEEIVAAALDRRSHGWTTVRPCAVYGPSDKETLAIFRAATYRIFPLPGRRRGRVALIHAADAADAIASLCECSPTGRIFELTDQHVEGYAWPEVVAAIETAIGAKVLALPLPGPVVRAAAVMNIVAARIAGRTPILTLGKVREFLHADWGSAADRLPPPNLWRPQISLDDGFRDTVSWYREQRWLPPVPAPAIKIGG
jgi:nucleoside-diphosphate-sugar epimerase